MKAVYEYPIPRGRLIALAALSLLYPTYVFVNMAMDMGRDAFKPTHPWWATLIYLVGLAGFGFLFLRLNRSHFRRGRLELDGDTLTIHFGAGIQSPGILGGTSFKGETLTIQLDEAFLEEAGLALNVRNRAYGTLTLAYGDAAQPLADWLAANGHPPVRAY